MRQDLFRQIRLSWLAATLCAASSAAPSLPARVPAAFEPAPDGASFTAHSSGRSLRVTRQGLEIVDRNGELFEVLWLGAQTRRPLEGLEPQQGRTTYFRGRGADSRRTAERYSRVLARGVYPGVDVEVYVRDGTPEYDFVLAAGVDAGAIRLGFNADASARIAADGSLLIQAGEGELRQGRPLAFLADGSEVAVQFERREDGEIGFTLGDYDRTQPLRIDPTLDFATFWGGQIGEEANGVALDADGNIYFVGLTRDLPPAPGSFHSVVNSSFDAFVTKLNPSGTEVLYNAVFGGSSNDRGLAIAVDAEGAAYVVGSSFSDDFPTTPGSAQPSFGGGSQDGFIAKLNPAGSQLIYSSMIGGSAFEDAQAVALDGSGAAYVAGTTGSADFPVTPGALRVQRGGDQSDGFVLKMSPDGAAFEQATYFGGEGRDEILGAAFDPTLGLVVAGHTGSADFPTTEAVFQAKVAGVDDAFWARLTAGLSGVEAATLFGGSSIDQAKAVAFDDGTVLLAGRTRSPDLPVGEDSYQKDWGGGVAFGDAFVARFSADGTDRLAATYLGGASEDEANGIVSDRSGNIFVVGTTGSPNFVTTPDAVMRSIEKLDEGFLVEFDPDGEELLYSTMIGGQEGDRGFAIAGDGARKIVIVGTTSSANFPATPGTVQPELASFLEGGDAYAAKFDFEPRPRFAATGVVNAASFRASSIAPGEIISIFGRGLGPQTPFGLALGPNGRVTTELGGVRVFFDGIAAPLTFVSERQINAIVPYGAARGIVVAIEVELDSARSDAVTLRAAPTVPGLFTLGDGTTRGAILNQDLSLNAPDNPAPRGSIVLLYATGEGLSEPAGVDGRLASDPLPRPRAAVTVRIGGVGAEVLYAGGAPGLVAGVIQINARVPAASLSGPAVPVSITAGGARSQSGVTLAIE